MGLIDFIILGLYFLTVLGIGFYYLKRNKDSEDYYVGGRSMGPGHIGLSVVATDVGGGFSIGLGGLGFAMGVSGSWMLFTGLIGAWLAAVLLIPKVFDFSRENKLMTFPQLLGKHYNGKVALLAGIISAIGYIGFTSSQLLAGAKLATATFPSISTLQALFFMGIIAIAYTSLGGLKAVVYTDTIQWIILMVGLIFVGIPVGFFAVGGMEGLRASLPAEFFSLTNVSAGKLGSWAVTIIPIWFIGMTLYQRIYASRSEKDAKNAWFLAGIFEYPIMAFMGVLLGMFGRAAAGQGMFAAIGYANVAEMDPELGLPLLLRNVLPTGVMGLLLAAYFSAIMSTADSCLMAASGNVLTDIFRGGDSSEMKKRPWFFSPHLITVSIGVLSLLLASAMQNVLELMLYSYAFMVSGLLIPVLGFLYFKKKSPAAALSSMFAGGGATLLITILEWELPYELEPIFIGIILSLVVFVVVTKFAKEK
ncbi:MAG: sodium:solute symporter [Candidatus Zixiibacteriota bacterium]